MPAGSPKSRHIPSARPHWSSLGGGCSWRMICVAYSSFRLNDCGEERDVIGMLRGSGRRWRKIRHAVQAPIGDSCKQGPGRSGNVHGARRVHSHRGTDSTGLPVSASLGTPPHGSGSRLLDARRMPGRHMLRIIRLSSFPNAPQRGGNRTRDVSPGVGNRYSFLLGSMMVLVRKGVLVLIDDCLRCT